MDPTHIYGRAGLRSAAWIRAIRENRLSTTISLAEEDPEYLDTYAADVWQLALTRSRRMTGLQRPWWNWMLQRVPGFEEAQVWEGLRLGSSWVHWWLSTAPPTQPAVWLQTLEILCHYPVPDSLQTAEAILQHWPEGAEHLAASRFYRPLVELDDVPLLDWYLQYAPHPGDRTLADLALQSDSPAILAAMGERAPENLRLAVTHRLSLVAADGPAVAYEGTPGHTLGRCLPYLLQRDLLTQDDLWALLWVTSGRRPEASRHLCQAWTGPPSGMVLTRALMVPDGEWVRAQIDRHLPAEGPDPQVRAHLLDHLDWAEKLDGESARLLIQRLQLTPRECLIQWWSMPTEERCYLELELYRQRLPDPTLEVEGRDPEWVVAGRRIPPEELEFYELAVRLDDFRHPDLADEGELTADPLAVPLPPLAEYLPEHPHPHLRQTIWSHLPYLEHRPQLEALAARIGLPEDLEDRYVTAIREYYPIETIEWWYEQGARWPVGLACGRPSSEVARHLFETAQLHAFPLGNLRHRHHLWEIGYAEYGPEDLRQVTPPPRLALMVSRWTPRVETWSWRHRPIWLATLAELDPVVRRQQLTVALCEPGDVEVVAAALALELAREVEGEASPFPIPEFPSADHYPTLSQWLRDRGQPAWSQASEEGGPVLYLQDEGRQEEGPLPGLRVYLDPRQPTLEPVTDSWWRQIARPRRAV